MSSTATEAPRRNGVDVATLFATLDAVKSQTEIAKFQFRASNTWVELAPTAARSCRTSMARCRRCSTSTSPRWTPTIPQYWLGRTMRRRMTDEVDHLQALRPLPELVS